MKILPTISLAMFFAVGVLAGCKGGGAGMAAPDPEAAACNAGCDKAKDEAIEKCAEEADQNACKIAAEAAREKCVSECKG